MEARNTLWAWTTAAMAGICLASGGCASFLAPPAPSMASVTKVFQKEEPIVAPNSVAVVWTTTTLEKATAPATRGFGGVVTFYGTDQSKPVRVSGELTVYAYDELSHKPDNAAPDRKYVFTKEQLEKHLGNGPAGPAYHIWIPWDEIGGPRREVCLILRFDPADGKAVVDKPTHAVLPGSKDDRDRLWASRTSQPTCTTTTAAAPPVTSPGGGQRAAAAPRMQTTTLTLPSGVSLCTAPPPAKPPKTEPRPAKTEPRP